MGEVAAGSPAWGCGHGSGTRGLSPGRQLGLPRGPRDPKPRCDPPPCRGGTASGLSPGGPQEKPPDQEGEGSAQAHGRRGGGPQEMKEGGDTPGGRTASDPPAQLPGDCPLWQHLTPTSPPDPAPPASPSRHQGAPGDRVPCQGVLGEALQAGPEVDTGWAVLAALGPAAKPLPEDRGHPFLPRRLPPRSQPEPGRGCPGLPDPSRPPGLGGGFWLRGVGHYLLMMRSSSQCRRCSRGPIVQIQVTGSSDSDLLCSFRRFLGLYGPNVGGSGQRSETRDPSSSGGWCSPAGSPLPLRTHPRCFDPHGGPARPGPHPLAATSRMSGCCFATWRIGAETGLTGGPEAGKPSRPPTPPLVLLAQASSWSGFARSHGQGVGLSPVGLGILRGSHVGALAWTRTLAQAPREGRAPAAEPWVGTGPPRRAPLPQLQGAATGAPRSCVLPALFMNK